jgi:hypothetical protein
MPDDVRTILLQTIEASLQAQLTAVRRLRKAAGGGTSPAQSPRRRESRSQISIVFDILEAAGQPLHITEIIEVAHKRFGQPLDRESLVSALTKRLARDDRFTRPAPNTFALRNPAPHRKEN